MFATTTTKTNTSDKSKLKAEERFSVTNNLHQGKRSVVFDPETVSAESMKEDYYIFHVTTKYVLM